LIKIKLIESTWQVYIMIGLIKIIDQFLSGNLFAAKNQST